MKKMNVISVGALISFVLLLIVGSETAYGAEASFGLLGCGGTHMKDPITNESIETAYGLRNLNTAETIMIDRIVIVDGNGLKLFDGLPGGYFKSTLGPMQSTMFPLKAILANYLPPESRPLQGYIVWHTEKGHPAESLIAGFVIETFDSTTRERKTMTRGGCEELDFKDSYNF